MTSHCPTQTTFLAHQSKIAPSPPSTPNNLDRTSLSMKKTQDMPATTTPPARPDAASRLSFCSVREMDGGLAQTFTSSKVSSYSFEPNYPLPHHAMAIEEDSASSTSGGEGLEELQYHPPLTQPHSRLHGYFIPADSFKGWKQIPVRGKKASRSFSDLTVLNMEWKSQSLPRPKSETYPPGQSPFEQLPYEVLRPIIDHLVIDIPTHGVTARNIDLMSLLLTSRTMHGATLNTLYKHVTIPHSKIFRKFLAHVEESPALGTLVRRLDFCHFNPSTIFTTAQERAAADNLTANKLTRCLELTPFLQEFLAQEYIEDDLTKSVLKQLFFNLPRLQAVDFCGCSSSKFKDAFQSILLYDWPARLPIKRLSMHKCLTLTSSVYETLMPRLTELTHLDVAGTRFTDAALLSIPVTARLTHLNLAKCNHLSARAVIDFLAYHPAAQSLVFLGLGMDARSNQLFDIEDLNELLPHIPSTLKSLNLRGSKMDSTHIPYLQRLSAHLEELALGRCLTVQNIDKLFVPDEPEDDHTAVPQPISTLRYLDLTDISPFDIDYSYLLGPKSALLKKVSAPLEVIEVSDPILQRLKKSSVTVERAGWTLKEFGSRSWVVRHASELGDARDDGRRSWKGGALFWGMRKVPVAEMDVGGMYGSFMFGRKL